MCLNDGEVFSFSLLKERGRKLRFIFHYTSSPLFYHPRNMQLLAYKACYELEMKREEAWQEKKSIKFWNEEECVLYSTICVLYCSTLKGAKNEHTSCHTYKKLQEWPQWEPTKECTVLLRADFFDGYPCSFMWARVRRCQKEEINERLLIAG